MSVAVIVAVAVAVVVASAVVAAVAVVAAAALAVTAGNQLNSRAVPGLSMNESWLSLLLLLRLLPQ